MVDIENQPPNVPTAIPGKSLSSDIYFPFNTANKLFLALVLTLPYLF